MRKIGCVPCDTAAATPKRGRGCHGRAQHMNRGGEGVERREGGL